jgi:hypothetical protein
MALTIETGAGVLAADSYVTATELDAFAVSYWGAALSGDTASKEAALRRAAAYLDGLTWTGQKAHGRDRQSMAWPRGWVTDRDGYAIAADEVPQEVKEAQMILARAELTEPGSLSPTFTASKQKTLVEVKGIKWQASGAGASPGSSRAYVIDALDRLKGLVRPVGQGSVVRA